MSDPELISLRSYQTFRFKFQIFRLPILYYSPLALAKSFGKGGAKTVGSRPPRALPEPVRLPGGPRKIFLPLEPGPVFCQGGHLGAPKIVLPLEPGHLSAQEAPRPPQDRPSEIYSLYFERSPPFTKYKAFNILYASHQSHSNNATFNEHPCVKMQKYKTSINQQVFHQHR